MIISIENRQKLIKVNNRRIRAILAKLMKLMHCENGEISIVLVDNASIIKLNQFYLKKDSPTNVLSFALSEGSFGDINPSILGDIVISLERAASDSKSAGVPLDDELDYLMIHGLLHLLGYKHEGTTDKERKRMVRKEKELYLQVKGYVLHER